MDGKTSINLKESLTYPHIVFSKRSGLRHVIDKLFENCGGYPQIAYSMEEDQGVAGLVLAGFNHRDCHSVLGETLLHGNFEECLSGTCYYEL